MKPKKIVFIMTDTQRKDMVSCYGNPDMHTPNLDRLASQGVRYEKAYTCQPVCGPARSAIFTGTFPHTNGSFANSIPLGELTKTLGQRFTKEGLHTAYIGKYHIDGGDYFGRGICPDGWDKDYWYDMKTYLNELSEEDRMRSRNYDTIYDDDFDENFTYAHRCSNRAIDFLEKYKDEDFCLVVSYDEPHDPSLCPKKYDQMFQNYVFPKNENVLDTLENKPEHQRIWAGNSLNLNRDEIKLTPRQLLACNAFVDSEIGRVINAIDEYAKDALVIYTSDHGDAMQSHCLYAKGPAMYDEITNIPFIVRWPGQVPQNKVSNTLISQINIVPTLLDYAGYNIPKTLEGKSLLSTFKDPNHKTDDEIFMEFTRYEVDHDGFGGFQPVRCAYDGRYKLSINLLTSDELYDMQEDPSEMNNLINSKEHEIIRNQLHDKILNWMNETRDPFRGYYWERRPWRKDAREATWSYTGMTRQRENEDGEERQLDYDTGLTMKDAVRKK